MSTPGGTVAGQDWRRWRAPLAVVALILLGAVAIALLQGTPATQPLDPSDTGPLGAHALVALLSQRGQTVVRAGSATAAARASSPGATLVITSPRALSQRDLGTLARPPVNLVIVAPGPAALAALAPVVGQAGEAPVSVRAPACGFAGARLAGTADMGGTLFSSWAPGAWRCYPPSAPSGGAPASQPAGQTSLVRYTMGGRIITVLGTGAPFSNSYLGRNGDASLAMNLLGSTRRVVWLAPAAVPPAGGTHGLAGLIPRPAYLVTLEIGIAVLLAALWRGRRFGPLVAEPLPVVVRACETVEGHGRLYRSRRARGRAAAALRAATAARLALLPGMPRDASPEATCSELARRTGRLPDEVRAVLFGPAPSDDGALVALANDLDTIEGQVLHP